MGVVGVLRGNWSGAKTAQPPEAAMSVDIHQVDCSLGGLPWSGFMHWVSLQGSEMFSVFDRQVEWPLYL